MVENKDLDGCFVWMGASEGLELESKEIDTRGFGMVMEDLDDDLDDLGAPDGLELESNGD